MTINEGWDVGCNVSSGLSSTALMAAADGDLDEATAAHLQVCPRCAERVRQIRLLQSQLRRRLYRIFCPQTDILVDYCQGLLDPYQRASIEHHLAICPHCHNEVTWLEAGGSDMDRQAPRPGLFLTARLLQ